MNTDPFQAALEPIIRRIVRDELAQLRATEPQSREPELVGVPEAARRTGIAADVVRAWIASGRLPRRLKNHGDTIRRPVYLVSIAEVRAAAEGPTAAGESDEERAARERASRILSTVKRR